MSTSTQTPITAARSSRRPVRDIGDPGRSSVGAPTSMAPLRSYLFVLAARTRSQRGGALIHYILEESPERAIQVCDQSYPDLRIVSLRDVTDRATAA
jgi:hypothetical protein